MISATSPAGKVLIDSDQNLYVQGPAYVWIRFNGCWYNDSGPELAKYVWNYKGETKNWIRRSQQGPGFLSYPCQVKVLDSEEIILQLIELQLHGY